MFRIKTAFAMSVLGTVLLWGLSRATTLLSADSHALAVEFTQVTGILSIAMMSISNILSARPRMLEPMLDGLDKMYRLHKWLGIGGLSVGILHWLTASGDGRGPGQMPAGATAAASTATTATADIATTVATTATDTAASGNGLLDWLAQYHGTAHGVGQPALFALIALVAIALIRRIPYRIFTKIHILVVPAYLVLVFHSVVLTKSAYWATPIGWLAAVCMILGTLAGFYATVRYFFGSGNAKGTVRSAHYYPELRVLEADLDIGAGWPGHLPGQFAFVTTNRSEGAHPYTIATAWDASDRRIGFIAKELGDHTSQLRAEFAAGKPAIIEGPYGNFTFDDAKTRQIWIGGGIGITPFVAKMRQLSKTPMGKVVDLFHTTKDESELALSKMRADAAAANVRLHVFVSPRDGRLDAARIMAEVPEWKLASVWFCGPTAFGSSLRKVLVEAGLSKDDFHQEIFEMR